MLAKPSSDIPSKPGVYVFKTTKEKVLYVGKAKNLRNRLRSYFHKSSGLDSRKSAMLSEAGDFSYIVTGNELEALVLEANLIKQYKPRFNVILRDDKNYPYLKLTVNEEWPRLEVVRKIRKDGSWYFGPYVPAGSMWEMLSFIRKNFRIRDCSYILDKPLRPCIQYQMQRCLAPCAGMISREEYRKLIEDIALFLRGKKKDLIDGLEHEMQTLAEKMRFEEAAAIRDRIKSLERAWESQKVVDPALGDMDVLGFYRGDSDALFRIFFIRNGIMIGSKDFFLKNIGNVTDRELIHTFIVQFYTKEVIPPSEVISSLLPEDSRALESWLGQRRGESVKIIIPKTGRRKKLIDMASENAALVHKAGKELKIDEMLKDIREKLRLERIPSDIGAFDVSTTSGSEPVGAFICWSDGNFQKDRYRRLRIKTVKGIDDYSMMEEIIERVVDGLDDNMPDLLIIDGGKGHLETARKVLERKIHGKKKYPMLISIAKDPDRAYLTNADEPIDLEDRSQSSLFLKSIRDEVHRFAIGYHRKLRDKELLQSPLETIPGIGKKRRLELLRVFGSIEDIRNATIEDIGNIKGFNRKIAEKLLKELRRIA